MRVKVLFFGMLKELAGTAADTIEMPSHSTVRDVLRHYESRIPELRTAMASLAMAVNQQYASPETALHPDDEIALLPPVSGGSGEPPEQASAPSTWLRAGSQPAGRRHYSSMTRERIDSARIAEGLKLGDDGASVVFEGIVRNQTRGRRTLYLDYEAYEEMAAEQLESLAKQALKQFQIRDVAIVHRLGRLEIGETSVLIVVASAHRGPAFDACRWLIDTLKKTVPIWKKEFFEDGAVWANGEPFPTDIRKANS